MIKLLATETNYIKGYGRISDLLGKTTYGLSFEEFNRYDKVWEEWEEDLSLPHYILPPNFLTRSIPKGTMRVYGENNA